MGGCEQMRTCMHVNRCVSVCTYMSGDSVDLNYSDSQVSFTLPVPKMFYDIHSPPPSGFWVLNQWYLSRTRTTGMSVRAWHSTLIEIDNLIECFIAAASDRCRGGPIYWPIQSDWCPFVSNWWTPLVKRFRSWAVKLLACLYPLFVYWIALLIGISLWCSNAKREQGTGFFFYSFLERYCFPECSNWTNWLL